MKGLTASPQHKWGHNIRCVSSARTDLCGGRRATGIPTATVVRLKHTPSAHRYAYRLESNGRLRQDSYSASPLLFSRQMVVADSPEAASPRIAARAVGKSLLLTPFRYRVASAASSVGVRRRKRGRRALRNGS